MKCPQDGTTLVMSERSGVEIDYCPDCRGVWLDRGELDKIIERSERDLDEPRGRERLDDAPRDRGSDKGRAPQHKKKKNWLSEVFEFGE